jgi:asparagine synthase (glutamine-hydrolysing)
MRQILPEAIIKRKKMGFPVPISQWFRGDSVHAIRSVFTSNAMREHGIFNVEYISRLLDEHVQGSRDNSEALWTVLNFELWTRIFIDGQACSSISDDLADSSRATQQVA